MAPLLLLLLLGAISSVGGYFSNKSLQEDAQKFNSEEAEKSRVFTAEQNALNRTFNSVEAEKSRQFLERMDSTKYQRMAEDYKAAGLNLGAIGGGGGLSSSGSSVASAGGSVGSFAAQSGISNFNSSAFSTAAIKVLGDNLDELKKSYFSNTVKAGKETVESFNVLKSVSDMEKNENLSVDELKRLFKDIPWLND